MTIANDPNETTPAQRRNAARVVAGFAHDAHDEELLLDMLGLNATEPEVLRPSRRKMTDSAAARCRRRYQAMDAFDPDTIRSRARRPVRRAG